MSAFSTHGAEQGGGLLPLRRVRRTVAGWVFARTWGAWV